MTLFVVTQTCVHFRCFVCYLSLRPWVLYTYVTQQGQSVDMLDWVDVFAGTCMLEY